VLRVLLVTMVEVDTVAGVTVPGVGFVTGVPGTPGLLGVEVKANGSQEVPVTVGPGVQVVPVSV